MSSMLDQAILDAETLREAALKNAESAVVEKYSDEVRERVEKLLEQDPEDDMDLGMEEDPMAEPDMDPATTRGRGPGYSQPKVPMPSIYLLCVSTFF